MALIRTTIEDATKDDIEYVASRMRQRDLDEFSALLPSDNLYDIVKAISERYGHTKGVSVAKYDGVPVAIGLTLCHRPNVVTLGLFATDDFPKVGVRVTKFILRELFPRLDQAGIHRIECVSLAGYHWAQRWLTTLGLKREAQLYNYGKNKEDFIMYARCHDCARSS
jgi:hypothetical protein